MTSVPIAQVRARLEERAAQLGLDPPDAALLADHLLDAELCGASSPRRRTDALDAPAGAPGRRPGALIERGDGIARYDGAGTLGYISLARALDAELAEPPRGARLVTISHCFPTGRLGYFAERAARSRRRLPADRHLHSADRAPRRRPADGRHEPASAWACPATPTRR